MRIEDIHDVLGTEFCDGSVTKSDKKPNLSKSMSWEKAIKQNEFMFVKIPVHIVLVDYDTNEGFECRVNMAKALKQHCIAIKGMNKGGHIYWFNKERKITKSNTANRTLLSITKVDYKCGIKVIASTGEIKPSKAAGCLSLEKDDDNTKRAPFREVVYCNLTRERELDEIPFYDLPLDQSIETFLNMGDGDGRNEKMRDYMIPFKKGGYSYEQFKEVAELINEYVMEAPLGAEELATVTRKELWDGINDGGTAFYSGKTFLYDEFAKYLKTQYRIRWINNQLHIYKDGVYMRDKKEIERAMIKHIPRLKSQQRSEVLKYLELICETAKTAPPHLIAFRNGIYNVITDTLQPCSPDIVLTNRIPWDYNQNAYSELADKTLDKISCFNHDIRLLLEECIGSCFYRSNKLGNGKCFIFTGDKNNGKSTYIEVIQKILGDNNISTVSLQGLNNKFENAALFGKLANLGDDIPDTFVVDVSTFKKLVSGNEMQIQRKGEEPFDFTNYAKLIFSANNVPRTKDPTGAVLKRLLIVPFNAKFTPNDPDYDPFIGTKLQEQQQIEYFIRIGIEGLKRVLRNREYTIPKEVENEMREYEMENNPILSFSEEIPKDEIKNHPTDEVYRRYDVFCAENGYQKMSKSRFSRELKKCLGIETKSTTIRGKHIRIYV